MALDIRITGVDQLVSKIQNLGSTARFSEAMINVYKQAQQTLEKARSYTPVDTGALRASGNVKFDGRSAIISFDSPYAIYVHENLHAHHPVGGAKFLERAVQEDTELFLEALAIGYRL